MKTELKSRSTSVSLILHRNFRSLHNFRLDGCFETTLISKPKADALFYNFSILKIQRVSQTMNDIVDPLENVMKLCSQNCVVPLFTAGKTGDFRCNELWVTTVDSVVDPWHFTKRKVGINLGSVFTQTQQSNGFQQILKCWCYLLWNTSQAVYSSLVETLMPSAGQPQKNCAGRNPKSLQIQVSQIRAVPSSSTWPMLQQVHFVFSIPHWMCGAMRPNPQFKKHTKCIKMPYVVCSPMCLASQTTLGSPYPSCTNSTELSQQNRSWLLSYPCSMSFNTLWTQPNMVLEFPVCISENFWHNQNAWCGNPQLVSIGHYIICH